MEKVCITGISGYIAGHIASLLLSRGYEVHGTVRSLKNKTRLQHLYDLETKNPNGKLVLFEADLTKEGSFDEAIKDCTYVLHVASPVETVTTKDPMESIVKPAVEGTLNVLRTCSRTPSVKRVVMTSSIWSITVWCEDRGKNYTFSDKDWNTLATANETPYAFSKKRAEEAAWEYVKNQKAFDLVTIIPGAMMGPLSSGDSAQPTPITLLIQMVSGKLLTMPKLPLYLVDVRDAALAHVKAMELSHCGNKRYLCVTEPDIWVSEAAVFAKKHYPNSPIITYPAPNWLFTLIPYWLAAKSEAILYAKRNSGKRFVFDVERTKKDLGITFTDPEITVKDTVESLISFGLLPKSYPLGAINVYVVGILLVVSLLIVYFVL